MDNKLLGLRYYAKIKDASNELLRQAIMNTEKQLMVFSDYRWQKCSYTGISTGAYIVFCRGVPIDHFTQAPDTVAQSGAESEYNAA